jgi:hypothetical protein
MYCVVLQVGGELLASELQNMLLNFLVTIHLQGGLNAVLVKYGTSMSIFECSNEVLFKYRESVMRAEKTPPSFLLVSQ